MLRAALLSAGLLVACLSHAAAQTPESLVRLRATVSSLADSAHIRVLAPGVVVNDGRFLGLRGDSLMVGDADARFPVGLDEIAGLSVRKSRWLDTGVQGAAIGLVTGAAVGFFLGYFNCGDMVQECGGHARSVSLRWGLVFGGGGGLAGALLGSRLRRWEPVFP